MSHKTDIGFIDAHAKSDGGNDDHSLLTEKALPVFETQFLLVIGNRFFEVFR